MNTSFAAQYAPEVALPSYGEWATPEQPEAGLAAPENLYDSQGNPLNYIQDQGGPRQFLVPRGQSALAPVPGNPSLQEEIPLRGRTAMPTPMLRGTTPQARDYPLGPNTDPQPQDLMRNGEQPTAGLTEQPGVRFGQRGVLPIPPASVRNGPRAVIPIPPSQSQIVARGSIQQRQTEDQVIGAAMDQRAMRNARNPAGSIQDEFNAGTAGGLGTLQRLIEDQGYGEAFSNFLNRLRGHSSDGPGRRSAPGAEMESELRLMSNPHSNLSMVDTPPGEVVPTSSRVGRGQDYNGRAQEVYDLLVSRGIRLRPGAGVRHNNALAGGHPEGNSIDIPPGQYERAIEIIREQYPNMPLQPIFIRRGQRFRNGVVATGDHYHVDMGDAALN